jgi:GntR family transcriptional regulator/MocR family aminotransferase
MSTARSPFPLALAGETGAPLFVQIADAVAGDVARGRLRPGDPLPGTRTLAEQLGVHRSTVVAAYAELTAQGWIAARPGGATRVAAQAPEAARRRPRAPASLPARPAYAIEPPAVPASIPLPTKRGTLHMFGGLPDLRLVPTELLARAYRRQARRHGPTLLGYGLDRRGQPALREAIARWLAAHRGLAATPETVMITRGSQMALDLLARALVRPSDAVAVEALSYPNAVNVFRKATANVMPVGVDEDGLDVAALAELAGRRPIRAVYLTSQHQYPTTVMLSPTRRLALLDLARRHDLAVIEDDYDHEFHFDGRPVLPLAATDGGRHVIYVGTFAKILAPGLRLGFVVAPPALVARLAAERSLIDGQGDGILECAVAELLDDGEVQRLARRSRRIYQDRREALCAAIDQDLPGVLDYRRPPGGLALWARVARGIDVEAWRARCATRDVHFQIGRQFTFDGAPAPFVRFGYASLDKQSLARARRVLRESLP